MSNEPKIVFFFNNVQQRKARVIVFCSALCTCMCSCVS